MIVCIMFYAIILEGAQARLAAPPPLPRARVSCPQGPAKNLERALQVQV